MLGFRRRTAEPCTGERKQPLRFRLVGREASGEPAHRSRARMAACPQLSMGKLQETSVAVDLLVPKLQAITGANPDAVIYVRGDKQLNYGRVLEVMSLVSTAGFRKVSLVAEAPKGPVAPAAANRPGTSVRR